MKIREAFHIFCKVISLQLIKTNGKKKNIVMYYEMILYFASLTTSKPLTVQITTNCGKFIEIRISDHLTCLLRNLYAD